MQARFSFEAELWLSSVEGTWVFVTLPSDIADSIGDVAPPSAGFGTVRVEVTLGSTKWLTSLFPDKASASYLLPVKKAVRAAEGLAIGDVVAIDISLVTDAQPRQG